MKVLIFSAYDPIPSDPAAPIRYARIAEEFMQRGHEVLYITSSFFHLTRRHRQQKHWYATHTPENMQLHMLKAKPYFRSAGLGRMKNHRQLALNMRRFLRQLPKEQHPQLIIAASPPLMPNRILSDWALKHRIPMVYDIQDLWPEEFIKLLPFAKGFRRLLQPSFRYARKLVAQAAAVTAVSQDYLDYYKNEIAGKPHQVFYLGKQTDTFVVAAAPQAPYRIVCLGRSQAGAQLLELAAAIQPLKDTELLVAGLGSLTNHFRNLLMLRKYERIHFSEWMSTGEMAEQLPQCAAGIILVDEMSRSAMPNRTFSYLAAGLPIISNIRGGELEQLIATHRLGLTLEDSRPESIAQAIRFCLENFTSEHERIQQFAREMFNQDKIYSKYCDWALDILNMNP